MLHEIQKVDADNAKTSCSDTFKEKQPAHNGFLRANSTCFLEVKPRSCGDQLVLLLTATRPCGSDTEGEEASVVHFSQDPLAFYPPPASPGAAVSDVKCASVHESGSEER